WRPSETGSEPPAGAAGGGAFKIRPEMMSIMGCSGEELGLILESLGFRREKRPVKKVAAVTAPSAVNGETQAANDNLVPVAANENAAPASADDASEAPAGAAIEGAPIEAALQLPEGG